jgi:hypothetical protein
MRDFKYKLDRNPRFRLFHHSEANSVAGSVFREARTGLRISQIAQFEFIVLQRSMFVPWNTTRSTPCYSQRQARGMGKSEVVSALRGMEIGAGQSDVP